ncbi:hypothetical protein UFOVP222_30 [uncultured Caudovirales phage]|uniref:Uncharacterized protein n=1 Tax=uncultured Caudovirales phage TaxID=2100421 RepID=A0A6J5TAZ3_9CAUD|nr:hypothetical protein UFOVP108_25 [uncultured Caudovirales phage]CAB5219148.1 hypothetical protein UFOVP222_30 [uncultured Caudovirales phage]
MANLYAEKIFAEHPIAIWSLDDSLTFTSFIKDSKNLINWTSTVSGSATNITSGVYYKAPKIKDSSVSLISTSSSPANIKFTSTESVPANNDFTISFYYFCEDPNVKTIEIGYGTQVVAFEVDKANKWNFISQNFSAVNSSIYPTINIKYITTGKSSHTLINGISIGSKTEEFSRISTGILPDPQSIFSFNNKVSPARSYLASGKNAYYFADKDGNLSAKSSTTPLVFGSNNCVVLYPNTDSSSNPVPSFAIPGYGMLNKSGAFKSLVLEFWGRINAQTSTPKRILGPISSADGLYVDGPFLRLRVGDNIQSAYIQEWARPMLFQFEVDQDLASVTINGEEVIRMLYKTSSLSLPETSSDWIGFYSYSDIKSFEIDCVSMYSYLMPNPVNKKHLIYGQAVKYPNDVVASHNGSSAVIDYSFANYSMNYNYPENGKWSHGFFDGLSFDNNVMSFANYDLPTFSSNDGSSLFNDMSTMSINSINSNGYGPFICLKPNGSGISKDWSAVESYIAFPQINVINQKVKAIWVNVETGSSNPTADQILLKVENISNSDYFIIVWASDKKLKYRYSINGTDYTYYQSSVKNTSSEICVGFDIDVLSLQDKLLGLFFESPNQLRVYVGGDANYVSGTTFEGTINAVGFSSVQNQQYFSTNFHTNGLIKSNVDYVDIASKYATYTLLPQIFMDKYIIDIATSAYWQDSLPLSFLSTTTIDENGNQTSALDYIQYNVNYPKPIASDGTNYLTSNNPVRMYAIFQRISNSSIIKGSSISTTELVPVSSIINNDVLNSAKKYEIVDNCIIVPPTDVEPNLLSMTIYFEMNTSAIFQNKLNIMSVQMSSQNASSTSDIGTKFGVPLSPQKSPETVVKNPLLISKDSTPHLWLSSKSGIALVGDAISNSLSIPLNSGQVDAYQISALQLFARWNYEEMPSGDTEIIKIKSANDSIFTLSIKKLDSDASRAIITPSSSDVSLFINGNEVGIATVNVREWTAIGVSFKTPVNLSLTYGSIVLESKMNFDNISYYLQSQFEIGQQWGYRQWYNVEYGDSGLGVEPNRSPLTWQTYGNDYTSASIAPNGSVGGWYSVEINNIPQNVGIYPSDVYNAFVGTNAISFNSEKNVYGNSVKLNLKNPEYALTIDTIPVQKTYLPV